MALRLLYPEASAQAHHAAVTANGESTHHHDQLTTGLTSRYFSRTSKIPRANVYTATSSRNAFD